MRQIDRVLMRRLLHGEPEDEEVWRSTEEGRHFKLETETGEIKAGFGGRLNGQKIKSREQRKMEKEAQPTRSEAANKTLQKIIKRIGNYKNEQHFIVGQDGTILLNTKGGKHMVATTVGQMREHGKGAIDIHNHPAGGTFSAPDLNKFGYGVTEILATGPDGTYCLRNLRVGKPDQYDGWYDMQQAYEAEIPSEVSWFELSRKADENLKDSPLRKRLDEINKRGVKMMNEGVPMEQVRAYMAEVDYDGLLKRIKEEREAEIRRLEVEPAHEFFKKNAARFGFEYTFTPRS